MASMSTPEDVVRRMAAECTFVDEHGAIGIRAEPATAMCGNMASSSGPCVVSGSPGRRNRGLCSEPTRYRGSPVRAVASRQSGDREGTSPGAMVAAAVKRADRTCRRRVCAFIRAQCRNYYRNNLLPCWYPDRAIPPPGGPYPAPCSLAPALGG
jgi:hypothetical protein